MSPVGVWSPDGKTLALTSPGHKTIEIWDAATYTLLKSIHVEVTRGMDWSPDGQTLYVSNESKVVAIQVSDGEILRSSSGSGRVIRMHWIEQGIQAEIVLGGLTIWNSTTHEISATIQQDIDYDQPPVVWSPAGKVRASFAGSLLLIQDEFSSTMQLQTPFNITDIETPIMVWSPDGTMLGVGGLPNPVEDGIVQIWNTQATMLLYQWTSSAPIAALAWSPNGKYIAISAGQDGQISIRDIGTGNILFRLLGHKTQTPGLAWSPDGQMIVSGDLDGQIFLWEIPANP